MIATQLTAGLPALRIGSFSARPNVSKRNMALLLLVVLAIALPTLAMAGGAGGGTEFQDVYDTISGWTSGLLGKTLGVSALLVGLGIGVVRQSVMAAAVGIAVALVAGVGPTVIDGMFTVAVPIVTPII